MAKISCGKELNSLPKLTGCPAEGEYFLVINATGGFGAGGYALRDWASLVICLLEGGMFLVYGDELVNGVYANSDYNNIELVVYYNGIGYLIPVDQYEQYAGGGFAITFRTEFTHEDVFMITPNGKII